jgi:hypothetical protein
VPPRPTQPPQSWRRVARRRRRGRPSGAGR